MNDLHVLSAFDFSSGNVGLAFQCARAEWVEKKDGAMSVIVIDVK